MNVRNFRFALCTIAFLLAVSGARLLGQANDVMISGTVKDQTGAVLPGATITVTESNMGVSRSTVTGQTGRYEVMALSSGTYQVRSDLTGFQKVITEEIKLAVGDHRTIDIVMPVGEMSEQVTVAAEASTVEPSRSSLTGLVENKAIQELPLNGRNFAQLAILQEGVVSYTSNRAGFFGGRNLKFSVYGARFNQNTFLLDGTNVNDIYNNSPGSVAGVLLGVDAVAEFEVITHNFGAEFGRTSGGIVNAVSKSGTNDVHGSLFEFLRNDNFDARNFFDRIRKPEFKRNQFGFSAGGPIKRDKTFLFGSFEALRDRLSTTNVGTVPDDNAHQGLLPTGDVGVAPKVAPYMALFPRANGRNLGGGAAEYVFSFNTPVNDEFFTVRADHNLNDRHSIFVRYNFDNANANRLPSIAPLPVFNEIEKSRNQYATIGDKISMKSMVASLSVGFNRSFSQVEDDPAAGVTAPPFRSDLAKMGQLSVGGLTTMGTDFRNPVSNALNLYQFSGDIALTRARHSLKFGARADVLLYNGSNPGYVYGAANFADLRGFLTGVTSVFMASIPGSNPDRSLKQSLFGMYLQDDYNLTRRLTVNLGLRYEPYTQPSERYGRIFGLKDPIHDAAYQQGVPYQNPSLRNFMPRVGLAWDPFGGGKTSIRSGFGVFFDPMTNYHLIPWTSLNPPFVYTNIFDGSFPDPFANFASFKDVKASAYEPAPFNLKDPYSLHYNLTIDRELLPDFLLRVGYAGAHGVHLARDAFISPVTPIVTMPDGRLFFPGGGPRLNPNFATVEVRPYDGDSFYNALLLKVERRFKGGHRFQLSYTYSKSVDDFSHMSTGESAANGRTVQDPFDRLADRALSNYDARHNLAANFNWELPFGPNSMWGAGVTGVAKQLVQGWSINGIVSHVSGNPFSALISGVYNPCSCSISERPDLRPGADTTDAILHNPDRWFDPSIFTLSDKGFFGNAGRNILTGPSLTNMDLSATKRFSLTENVGAEFRSEFFNLFNHANFGLPSVNTISAAGATLSTAGKISNTVNPSRQLQFGLKLTF